MPKIKRKVGEWGIGGGGEWGRVTVLVFGIRCTASPLQAFGRVWWFTNVSMRKQGRS